MSTLPLDTATYSTFTTISTSATPSTAPILTDTGIVYGPAITASSLAFTGTSYENSAASSATSTASPNGDGNGNGNGNSNQSTGSFSNSSRDIVIATTTVGGTIILALLFYAMWRRKRSVSSSESVEIAFQPQDSQTQHIVMQDRRPDEKRLTALPIYHDAADPARSSYYPSLSDHPRTSRGVTFLSPPSVDDEPVPRRLAFRDHARSYLSDSANPWADDADYRGSPITDPGQSAVAKRAKLTAAHPLTISIQSPSPIEGRSTSQLGTPNSTRSFWNRWSWTNSQAPTTPRFTADRDSSPSSGKLRSVASWIKAQTRHSNPEEAPPSTGRRPLLKNQASKPVLGPPLSRLGVNTPTKSRFTITERP